MVLLATPKLDEEQVSASVVSDLRALERLIFSLHDSLASSIIRKCVYVLRLRHTHNMCVLVRQVGDGHRRCPGRSARFPEKQ